MSSQIPFRPEETSHSKIVVPVGNRAASLVQGVATFGVDSNQSKGTSMTDPIVFISHSVVKEGKLGALEEFTKETFPVLEAEKPRTVLHNGFIDEDGTHVHFVHVFPDADAMDQHMLGVAERSGRADEFIETQGFEIYGTPNADTLAMLRQAPGIDVVVRPGNLGGYIRLGQK